MTRGFQQFQMTLRTDGSRLSVPDAGSRLKLMSADGGGVLVGAVC